MASSDISICSTACLLVGANEIESFTQGTQEAKVCAAIYTVTKDNLLSTHPWRFSLGQVSLARLTATPLFGFTYAFQLPPDFIRLININPDSNYKIHEDKIYCDLTTCDITYQFSPSEAKFPPYFVRLVELEMASLLAASLVEDLSKQQMFQALAEKESRKSRNTDSQNHKGVQVSTSNFGMTKVRFPR